ncbi:hypothetical protein DMN91_002866, partial [Ooceraea biroi]
MTGGEHREPGRSRVLADFQRHWSTALTYRTFGLPSRGSARQLYHCLHALPPSTEAGPLARAGGGSFRLVPVGVWPLWQGTTGSSNGNERRKKNKMKGNGSDLAWIDELTEEQTRRHLEDRGLSLLGILPVLRTRLRHEFHSFRELEDIASRVERSYLAEKNYRPPLPPKQSIFPDLAYRAPKGKAKGPATVAAVNAAPKRENGKKERAQPAESVNAAANNATAPSPVTSIITEVPRRISTHLDEVPSRMGERAARRLWEAFWSRHRPIWDHLWACIEEEDDGFWPDLEDVTRQMRETAYRHPRILVQDWTALRTVQTQTDRRITGGTEDVGVQASEPPPARNPLPAPKEPPTGPVR